MTTSTRPARGREWTNWSGSVAFQPKEIVTPRSLEELARVVGHYGNAGRHIRVTGAGHSFTPLVRSDDVLISMAGLQGITAADPQAGTVSVLGGARLKALGDELLRRGLAQENLGDIDVQTITGAISTGTHGTGVSFGSISTQVVALKLVTASGELLELSEERQPEYFKAAQVSLGALGVIAEVTLRVVPAKRLHYQTRRERLDSVLDNLERYKHENSHFEFFWLPYTDWTQAKFTNETDEQPTSANLWTDFNRVVIENGVFWALSEGARIAPPLSKTVSAISAWGIAPTTAVDYSHRIFATPRAVRFQEMEYNVPAESFVPIMRELQALITRRGYHVHFPIECRFVRGDDIWLSPAYQRDSAYLAAHMYKGMRYEEYFREVEHIYQCYDGRPHWGKMHTLDAATLASRYPRWSDFQRVRAELDPQGVFLNDYLRRLFGVDGGAADEIGGANSERA
ncbi:MAG TPA: D-arabinono-1,4-lactone oxidase [Ktedonobacterales bacterium]